MVGLKNLARKLLFFLLYVSCIPLIIREIFQRKKITIISFHNISPKHSKKILSYLKKSYNIISLKDYASLFKTSNSKNFQIPPKALIITIDDGLKENYDFFNTVKELNIPITLFITSGIVGTMKGFWWNHNNTKYSTEELKEFDDKKRIELLNKYGFSSNDNLSKREALSFDEIEKMKTLIDFQSHSVSHPILTRCDSEKSKNEIFQSKKDLESIFNLDIYAFAHPNGNYSNREIEYVKSAGYTCALNTDNGFNTILSNPYNLNRISGGIGNNFYETIVKTSGLWYKLLNLFYK